METITTEEKKAGTCQKCGKETDDLQPVFDSALDDYFNVCPDCADIIEIDNQLYAKAALVGCAIFVVFGVLVSLAALIFYVLC